MINKRGRGCYVERGSKSAAPAELKRESIFKRDENRKEICAAAKGFCETALLGTAHRLHGCAWGCTV